VGKTYFSSKFMVINSEMYLSERVTEYGFSTMEDRSALHVSYLDDPLPGVGNFIFGEHRLKKSKQDCYCEYEYVPYVNLGLLIGMKRSGDGKIAFIGDDDSIGARCTTLVRGHGKFMKMDLIRLFIKLNAKALKNAKNIPYFVPTKWGGLGLPTVEKSRFKGKVVFYKGFGPSAIDRRVVGHMISLSKAFDNKHHTFDEKTNRAYKRLAKIPTVSKEEPDSPYYNLAMKALKEKFGVTYGRDYCLGRAIWLSYDVKMNTGKDGAVENCNSRLSLWWQMATSVVNGLKTNTHYDIRYMNNNSPLKEIPAVRLTFEEYVSEDVYEDE